MNIFKEYDDIYGKIDIADIKNNFKELFEIIKSMREQLGRQKYVLDIYLHDFFKGVNSNDDYSVCMDAFDGSCCNGLLRKTLQNSKEKINHPLYQKTKEKIENKPIPFLESRTKHSLYFTELFFDYAEYEIKEYSKLSFDTAHSKYDIVKLYQTYKQISFLLGNKELIEKLNELLEKCFLRTRIIDAFYQSLLKHLLGTLTYRDSETGKLIFQILLG